MSVTIDGSAGVTTNTGAVYNGLQTATAQASTSGTSIDFTGVPLWVKRITVMFNGVSTSGTSNVQIQIGSGSVTTSGYASFCGRLNNGGTGLPAASFTTGFQAVNQLTAAQTINGLCLIVAMPSNSFGYSSNLGTTDSLMLSTGVVTLAGSLDRVRITTVNGTDTFDAGSINIMYE